MKENLGQQQKKLKKILFSCRKSRVSRKNNNTKLSKLYEIDGKEEKNVLILWLKLKISSSNETAPEITDFLMCKRARTLRLALRAS